MVELTPEERGVGCSIHPRGTHFTFFRIFCIVIVREKRKNGAYGVAATRQSVALQSRVQLPLGTPKYKNLFIEVFVFCAERRDEELRYIIFLLQKRQNFSPCSLLPNYDLTRMRICNSSPVRDCESCSFSPRSSITDRNSRNRCVWRNCAVIKYP